MRILTGIQPSGKLHWGNYFGAMQPSIGMQDKGDAFIFIAQYHALTTVHDAASLRQATFDVAADFLACGLDPAKACLFRQADVPEVHELAWLLSTVTPMGLLERCHSYKDKLARGIAASHGLFAYPVLMAADILAYQSDVVPVGRDQKQHVEVTRDIAAKFNQAYGAEVFKLTDDFRIGGSDSRFGRTEDEQELQQYHRSLRSAQGGQGQNHENCHRLHAAGRPERSRYLPRIRAL